MISACFQRESPAKIVVTGLVTYSNLSIKPKDVGSRTVDEAPTSVLKIEVYNFLTSKERPREIETVTCNAHKGATSASQASGTSAHTVNMNSEACQHLIKLYVHARRIN